MDALLLVLGVGVALIIAYFTYGRWVAARVFQLRKDTATPATVLCDNTDYCPTPKSIVFGHHFTSIAGTGPIVGPAIAVMWGWLPAVLWVLIGSIFIGAVHDLGSLVVSMRNKGRSVGDIAGDLLGPRVRLIFLVVLVMALWVVLAIFGLVVASVLRQYPGAIFPVLVQIPLAVAIGLFVHRRGKNIVIPSIIALGLMYASVIWGDWGPLHTFNTALATLPMWAWVVGLLGYSYIASVLPVWVLLQPRDYINALQLISALGLIVVGLIVAATIGGAPSQSPERERGVAVAPHNETTTAEPIASRNVNHRDAEITEGIRGGLSGDLNQDAGSERANASEEPDRSSDLATNHAHEDVGMPLESADPDGALVLPALRQGHEESSEYAERVALTEDGQDHGTVGRDHSFTSDRPKLEIVAPVVNWQPEGAPPLLPVLFITIACGAVSGFHCLVGSGTTSKQIANELDAKAIGYGSMLTEAFLATLVIAACAAGIGLGIAKSFDASMLSYGSWSMRELPIQLRNGDEIRALRATGPEGGVSVTRQPDSRIDGILNVISIPPDVDFAHSALGPDGSPAVFIELDGERRRAESIGQQRINDDQWLAIGDSEVRGFIDDELQLRGPLAWDAQYQTWGSAQGLVSTVGAFVEGAANFVKSIGISGAVAVALMGVLVASFAGTTMDTACRLQRYVIQELARTFLPRPPSSACHRCGYELKGLESELSNGAGEGHPNDAGSERSEDPDQVAPDNDQPSEPSLRSDSASETIRCPECGAINRWHLETASHPDERAPETHGWDAIEKHASPLNPFKWLATRHGATLFAVITAAALAGLPAPGQSWSLANFGQGGLILWPLFGATNQLLGGLAFLVIGAWLIATKRPWWFIALPAVFMLIVPAWALIWQGFIGNESNESWVQSGRWVLVGVAGVTILLEVWLVIEVALRAAKSRKGLNAALTP